MLFCVTYRHPHDFLSITPHVSRARMETPFEYRGEIYVRHNNKKEGKVFVFKDVVKL